jgi:hypothetical protein
MAGVQPRPAADAVPAIFLGPHGTASLEPRPRRFRNTRHSAAPSMPSFQATGTSAGTWDLGPNPLHGLTYSRYSARLRPGTLHIVAVHRPRCSIRSQAGAFAQHPPLVGTTSSPSLPVANPRRSAATRSKPVNSHPVARKTNRRASSRARRQGTRPGTATAPRPQAPAAPAQGQGQAAAVGGDQAFIRSVEMTLAPGAPARRPGARSRGGRIVLETADPAIPLDRVPYFLTDLARLGIVAGIMVVLLILAALFVIPLVVR